MKLLLLSSAVLAGSAMLFVGPQQLLDKQAAALKDAKSLKVTYNLQHLPGSPVAYTLTYSKPNLLLIDGPDRTVESDGKTLWEYNKTAKTYTEGPVSGEAILKKAQADEVLAWACFFSADHLKGITNLQSGQTRVMRGNPITEVTFTLAGSTSRTVTLFVDDKLGIARGMSLKTPSGDLLAVATTIEMTNNALDADKFAFVAPAGVTKAVAPAADAIGWSTIQPVFASNCSPCHAGRGRGGFSIASYESVMRGSESGPVITPGDADGSRLIQLITGQAQPKMPPMRNVSQDDIDKLKAWIKAGAKQ